MSTWEIPDSNSCNIHPPHQEKKKAQQMIIKPTLQIDTFLKEFLT